MRIALIGTRGVPARYGGFETAVEEIGRRLAHAGHEVVVYCRGHSDDETEPPETYRGMELVHLPALKQRSLETLSHTALSVFHRSLAGTDAAIVFNSANAPLLPIIRARGIPVATHVDGLEWKRAKWGPIGQRYYRLAESLAVRWSDALIADAQGIADYYADEFGASTNLITYGAPILSSPGRQHLVDLGLDQHAYHLVVARFEPENHVLEIVEGFRTSTANLPLVVAGSAPYAAGYIAQVRAAADHRVRFLGGIWDQDQLDQLYAHALTYVHGHSVGGTNPSLLRAIGAGTHTIAFDVNFNQEVMDGHGAYFRSAPDVAREIVRAESDPAFAKVSGRRLQESAGRYNWDDVTSRYLELCEGLKNGSHPPRVSGRRRASRNRRSATHLAAAPSKMAL